MLSILRPRIWTQEKNLACDSTACRSTYILTPQCILQGQARKSDIEILVLLRGMAANTEFQGLSQFTFFRTISCYVHLHTQIQATGHEASSCLLGDVPDRP